MHESVSVRPSQLDPIFMDTFSEDRTQVALCRVKWFDIARGYGFASPADGGSDILLHYNLLAEYGRKILPEGSVIRARFRDGPRGRKAVKILESDLPCRGENRTATRKTRPDTSLMPRVDPLQFLDNAGAFEPATVRWFHRVRGYGFLIAENDDIQLFVHMESVRRAGLLTLLPGQRVKVRRYNGPRGALAIVIEADVSGQVSQK